MCELIGIIDPKIQDCHYHIHSLPFPETLFIKLRLVFFVDASKFFAHEYAPEYNGTTPNNLYLLTKLM